MVSFLYYSINLVSYLIFNLSIFQFGHFLQQFRILICFLKLLSQSAICRTFFSMATDKSCDIPIESWSIYSFQRLVHFLFQISQQRKFFTDNFFIIRKCSNCHQAEVVIFANFCKFFQKVCSIFSSIPDLDSSPDVFTCTRIF